MKATITLDDGTVHELIEATSAGVPVGEVAKVEGEVAAVDAELKADTTATA